MKKKFKGFLLYKSNFDSAAAPYPDSYAFVFGGDSENDLVHLPSSESPTGVTLDFEEIDALAEAFESMKCCGSCKYWRIGNDTYYCFPLEEGDDPFDLNEVKEANRFDKCSKWVFGGKG